MLWPFVAVLATLCAFAPSAGAVLVHVGKRQIAGIAPHLGVSPASIPGSFARRGTAPNGFSSNGNLDYNGGPVLHSSAPYLIFWDPSSGISSASRALLEHYFTDTAADSGKATNVFGVARQFTDSTGFADYAQTFSAGTQAIPDPQPYPARDTVNCPDTASTYPTCLTDVQLHTEITRLISADGLPTGIGANAPIYFVVTPGNVNVCSDSADCADNVFCAYHSSFTDPSSDTVLYAAIPLFFDGASSSQNPKSCQEDGNPQVQEPNGDLADVAVKYMSHEDNETITDPLGTAWWNTLSGNEDGDNCNFYGPTVNPNNSSNPNAFKPYLGGSAALGTLFDQVINGNHYYTQTEWSNGNVNCEAQPASSSLSPDMARSDQSGTTVSFDPSSSVSSAPISSTTWSFGDGSSSFVRGGPAVVSHTYSSAGTYTATLTLVDNFGNLATVTDTVTVPLSAAFSVTTARPEATTPVSFDGSGSSDPDGSISSYSWNFGDGTTGSGATASHTYAAAGAYAVTMTVSDSSGTTATVSHTVTVGPPPTAAFSVTTPSPVPGSPVAFDGSGSNEPGGSISSYSWNFGDGSAAGSGVTPTHTYTSAGNYTVTLTVTDGFGATATAAHPVTVAAQPVTPVRGIPTAVITVGSPHPVAGATVSLSGARSTDTGSTIVSYSWKFGDGQTGTDASVLHRYAKPGHYTVALTVTDASGVTSTATKTLTVSSASITSFSVKKGQKIERLTLVISGAGTLTLGAKRFKIRKAEKFVLKIKLTQAQIASLTLHNSVTLKLKFVPTVGNASRKTIKFNG